LPLSNTDKKSPYKKTQNNRQFGKFKKYFAGTFRKDFSNGFHPFSGNSFFRLVILRKKFAGAKIFYLARLMHKKF